MHESARPGADLAMSTRGPSPFDTLARYFERERRNLVAYLLHRARVLEEMDAEDVVSDVALRLFEQPDLVGGVENLAGYVTRALQRRVVDWIRERRATVPVDDGMLRDEGRPAEDAEFRRRLFEALAALPEAQRAVWIATQLEGDTFQELSERWGVPLGTLLARKHRATAALRAALRDLTTSRGTP
jgi:RNA polymerase sigma factor (sigma-70 family)